MIREQELDNTEALGAMTAALLMKKGSRLDAALSEVLTDDYLDALEDLPAWCVREALRKWNRAESVPLDKKPHDFNWRPEPPTLRRLALLELLQVKSRISSLQRLLEARPAPEYDDRHKATMLGKFAEVLRGIARRAQEETQSKAPDPGHAARVMADLEGRRSSRAS